MPTNFEKFKKFHTKLENNNKNSNVSWDPYEQFNFNKGAINDLVDIMDDCCICFCYGCRNFEPRNNECEYISKKECHEYIKYYMSKEYDPYTDDCWCSSCIKASNKQKINLVKIYMDNNDAGVTINSDSVQKAKAISINKGFYKPEDYIKLKYEIVE